MNRKGETRGDAGESWNFFTQTLARKDDALVEERDVATYYAYAVAWIEEYSAFRIVRGRLVMMICLLGEESRALRFSPSVTSCFFIVKLSLLAEVCAAFFQQTKGEEEAVQYMSCTSFNIMRCRLYHTMMLYCSQVLRSNRLEGGKWGAT